MLIKKSLIEDYAARLALNRTFCYPVIFISNISIRGEKHMKCTLYGQKFV